MTTIVQDNIAAEDDGPSEDWIEGYEAACSQRDDSEIRLECVRLATNQTSSIVGNNKKDLMATAREIYGFVTGRTCAVCGGERHAEGDEDNDGEAIH